VSECECVCVCEREREREREIDLVRGATYDLSLVQSLARDSVRVDVE
jgi:hypothetical protein